MKNEKNGQFSEWLLGEPFYCIDESGKGLEMPGKATHGTDRRSIARFDQIINIGTAMTADFIRLGFEKPRELIGQNPLRLYQEICRIDGVFNDPCVLDVYLATIDFMNGNPPRQWWDYTQQRKEQFSDEVNVLRARYSVRVSEAPDRGSAKST